ncbi:MULTISPECIES: DUF4352 domain-containing protein [Bacillota]|jgi:hypothetical protein|uniref:DUF4352 domain-containing protein n=2 Tax=Amedibacillus TaxID=2749846 RepID=A0A7G9GM07_9FIRM|nr:MULTISPECIES: DUF4352 domain-containing protein [Bacillota]QNM11839.1 DUF4352 domain-containing protein [[Eubacterium] hominis]MCH4287238.1 DUF4352 domain-containing protein [Amedibacillus hominis]RGB50651.1 DUF4352 domain-containing protein [Absiella sp. AM22-9]RGB62928.1 DUF4352 domain-containing protein [Absiella sp. AM10-20]RGB64853.1 DUF4352 domain-containing protein [Absiella sp. AM09-45]
MKKLKKWQIALIVLLAIGVIGGAAGGGDSEKKEEEKQQETSKNEDKKDNQEEQKEEQKEEKKEEQKEEKVYGIGDTQKVGKVEYTVVSKDVTDHIGDEYFGVAAQNEFMILTVKITNHGDKSLTVADSFFNLVDGSKTFKTDSGDAIYLEDDSIIFKEINPDASLTGKVIFDISENTVKSSNLQLQVQTGAWGTEKGYFKLN